MSMDLEGQQQKNCDNHNENVPNNQQQDLVAAASSHLPIRRTIILLLVLIVIPCLSYYYLTRFLVPENPLLEINYMSVERSPLPEEDTEVSKWYVNLTIHNPDKRWHGNFQDVRFRLIREGGEKENVVSKKVVEPFWLGSTEGLQIILNMEELDSMEQEDWEEQSFALRMHVKVSFADSDDELVDDYWEISRECAFLRLEIKETIGLLKNDVPMWCDDHVRVVPRRHLFWI